MAETILTSGDLLPQLIGIPDASDWRGRLPATPVWQQGVTPQVRVWGAKGEDFRQQFRVNERGVFVYGEICGMEAYAQGTWSWDDGAGHTGSGSLACYYTFETTGEDHDVVVHQEVTGDGYISASPVGFHSERPDGGRYTVIETAGSGKTYERTVGSMTLTTEVTDGLLRSYAAEWATQTAEFREGTKTGDLFAYQSGTKSGWWAAVQQGHARHTADISAAAGGYDGWSGAFQVGLVLERRKNQPVLYDEGDFGAAGNDIYRTGSARWILLQEILEDPYKDNYGPYGHDTAPRRDKAFAEAPWTASPSGLITGVLNGVPQYIGRNSLLSADGKRYRVTAQAGEGFGEEWEAVDTQTVVTEAGEEAILEFNRETLEETPAGLTRITLIEEWDPEEEVWGVVASYPESEALVGRDIGVPGIRIYAAYQIRNGPKWGHQAFDGSDRYFRYKRLVKVAALA